MSRLEKVYRWFKKEDLVFIVISWMMWQTKNGMSDENWLYMAHRPHTLKAPTLTNPTKFPVLVWWKELKEKVIVRFEMQFSPFSVFVLTRVFFPIIIDFMQLLTYCTPAIPIQLAITKMNEPAHVKHTHTHIMYNPKTMKSQCVCDVPTLTLPTT